MRPHPRAKNLLVQNQHCVNVLLNRIYASLSIKGVIEDEPLSTELRAYREKWLQLIDNHALLVLTANSYEIFDNLLGVQSKIQALTLATTLVDELGERSNLKAGLHSSNVVVYSHIVLGVCARCLNSLIVLSSPCRSQRLDIVALCWLQTESSQEYCLWLRKLRQGQIEQTVLILQVGNSTFVHQHFRLTALLKVFIHF